MRDLVFAIATEARRGTTSGTGYRLAHPSPVRVSLWPNLSIVLLVPRDR
jgi:hypothetical protein